MHIFKLKYGTGIHNSSFIFFPERNNFPVKLLSTYGSITSAHIYLAVIVTVF